MSLGQAERARQPVTRSACLVDSDRDTQATGAFRLSTIGMIALLVPACRRMYRTMSARARLAAAVLDAKRTRPWGVGLLCDRTKLKLTVAVTPKLLKLRSGLPTVEVRWARLRYAF